MQKNSTKKSLKRSDMKQVIFKPVSCDLRSLVINWNNDFPVDYWWRKHFNVPFGSVKHRQMSFLYMAFEYIEFVEYKIIELNNRIESKRQTDIKNNELFTQTSPGKEVLHMTRKEAAEEYENLDLSQFDD